VTLELNERLTPEVVDAYLQRLLWEKDVVNSLGLTLEIFRIKVSIRMFAFNVLWNNNDIEIAMKGIVRYSQPETDHPSFVIIQAVYDTYDILPVKGESRNSDDLRSQPDVRFVFIGIISLFEKTSSSAVLYRISSIFLLFNVLQVAIWSLVFWKMLCCNFFIRNKAAANTGARVLSMESKVVFSEWNV
jgi:hypothetical protein